MRVFVLVLLPALVFVFAGAKSSLRSKFYIAQDIILLACAAIVDADADAEAGAGAGAQSAAATKAPRFERDEIYSLALFSFPSRRTTSAESAREGRQRNLLLNLWPQALSIKCAPAGSALARLASLFKPAVQVRARREEKQLRTSS